LQPGKAIRRHRNLAALMVQRETESSLVPPGGRHDFLPPRATPNAPKFCHCTIGFFPCVGTLLWRWLMENELRPSMRSRVRPWLLTTLLLLGIYGFHSTLAWGQITSGSLTGVVSDPTGGVIPGAKVLLTDTDKAYDYPLQPTLPGSTSSPIFPPALTRLVSKLQVSKPTPSRALSLTWAPGSR
jgi:hypothetical protein